tara:strand:- start:72 stop:605 length:534 start_codon:yes stop_codon:yes gene_type:complete
MKTPDRSTIKFCAAAGAFAFGLFHYTTVRKSYQFNNEVLHEIDRVGNFDDLEHIQDHILQTHAFVQSMEDQIPAVSNVSQIVSDLASMMNQSGLDHCTLKSDAPATNHGVLSIDIGVAFEGTYEQLVVLFQKISKQNSSWHLRRMYLCHSKNETDTNALSVKADFTFFGRHADGGGM